MRMNVKRVLMYHKGGMSNQPCLNYTVVNTQSIEQDNNTIIGMDIVSAIFT